MKTGNSSTASSGKDILLEGIENLRQKDSCFESVIASRSEEIIFLLDRYIKEIELFNSAYGLVGVNNTEELVIKHILDSLAPLGIISHLLNGLCAANGTGKTPQIADAGSGSGLPGIPLAIAMPNCDFTLIERMGRRASFLWNAKAALGLSNITVEEGELEKTAPGRFTLIIFRAFKPLEPKLLKSLFAACEKGGVIAAYKGRREKIDLEISSLTNSGKPDALASSIKIIPYEVPFLDEERHLVVIGG